MEPHLKNRMNNRNRFAHLFVATGILAFAGAPLALALPGSPDGAPLTMSQDQPDRTPRDRNPDRNPDRDRDRDQRDQDRRDRDQRNPDGQRNTPTDGQVEAKPVKLNEITTAKKLLGTEIHSTTTGKSIGKAADLIISADTGDIEWVIVDKRGLLTHLIAVKMDQVAWDNNQSRFNTPITEEHLEALPTFKADEWANLRHESWFGALKGSIVGDERTDLGIVHHVRAKDILGKPLMVDANYVLDPDRTPSEREREIERRRERENIETTEVAKIHDIVLAMNIERAPILIAQYGGFMQETVQKAVPINAVEWSEREPLIYHMTKAHFEALMPLPKDFPAGLTDPTPIVRSFESFRVRPLVRLASDTNDRW